MIDSYTKPIALIGNPARHSLSPKIQNHFIRTYNQNAVYLVFEFSENNLREAFCGAKNLGFVGLNVTMPYKEKIYKMVDKLDSTSSITKSVNTVKFEGEGRISEGFNTDVNGFLISLKDKKFKWEGKNCLVIGAGGAARSAVYGILKNPVRTLYLCNKTKKKALDILKIFKKISSDRIEVISNLNDIKDDTKNIDLIVNCTPMGMDLSDYKKLLPVPENWDLKGKFVFDMVYNPVKTRFIDKAIREGAEIITGIDMLINQAAYSFKIWFNILPETEDIKKELLKGVK